MVFKDHFSNHAAGYAQSRPHYPESLFEFLRDRCAAHNLAWDCATGNGQAAVALSQYFDTVIATDGSAQQISEAQTRPNIQYRQATAESRFLEKASCDLVTVAQALHWFDTEKFFDNVDHCLKPEGVLAVWSYGIHEVNEAIDAVVSKLYGEVLEDYWPPERRLVENQYRDVDFPFETSEERGLMMSREWDFDQLGAYIRSWSALQRYKARQGTDPLLLVEAELLEAWGGDRQKTYSVQWPLTVILARR